MRRPFLVLDLETVIDPELYTPPPEADGGERQFPPPHVHRPIVIGALWLGAHYQPLELGFIGQGLDEAALLGEFAHTLGRRLPRLVSYNGRGFDLPVLALRALRHGIPLGYLYGEQTALGLLGEELHIDVCDFLCNHGHGSTRRISLDAAARLIGLPGKLGIDGRQVAALYAAGALDEINAYCLADVVQTGFLFLRLLLLRGTLEIEGYRDHAAALLALAERDGRLKALVDRCDRSRLLLV